MSGLIRTLALTSALLFSSFIQPLLAANLNWALEKTKDGVEVYTAKVEQSKFMAFRAETVIHDQDIDTVLNVIRDVPGLVDWFYTCYDPVLLEEENASSRIIYMKNTSPSFLVSERDIVFRQEVKRDAPDRASIVITNLPEHIPPKKGFVRIPTFEGGWTLERAGNDVKVVYSALMDPGGNVPAAINNMMLVKMPFETLRRLSQVIAQK